MQIDKAKIYGAVGTAIFYSLLFLLLWFVAMPTPEKWIEDEGIVVSFGTDADGIGFGEMPAQIDADSYIPPKPIAEQQKLITQDNTPSVQLPKQQENKNNKKIEQQKELRKQEQRMAAKAAAEQRKRDEATTKANNLLGGAFGNSGSGSGATQGDIRQGNPAGSGTSGGHGWSLSGRSLMGALATPEYPSNVEGKITISIRVNAAGNVTNANVSSPTNISDAQTRNAAIRAAKQTRFSVGSGISVGTITYNFKLE